MQKQSHPGRREHERKREWHCGFARGMMTSAEGGAAKSDERLRGKGRAFNVSPRTHGPESCCLGAVLKEDAVKRMQCCAACAAHVLYDASGAKWIHTQPWPWTCVAERRCGRRKEKIYRRTHAIRYAACVLIHTSGSLCAACAKRLVKKRRKGRRTCGES